jgi:heme oxygenase
MVGRLWGLYSPLENALAVIDWVGAETLVRARRKTPWLVADLTALGIDPAHLPQARALPAITNSADVLGVLYVLEGATLGGQVVLRWLTERLGLSATDGAQFFSSYGPRVGLMWRAYLETLEHFGVDPDVGDRIESAALSTFAVFGQWMSAEGRLADSGGLQDVF